MTIEQKVKIQNALTFNQSDIWDVVMLILDEAIKAESQHAMSSGIDESKRAHQCGRADGISYVKELLNDTHSQALLNVGRKTS